MISAAANKLSCASCGQLGFEVRRDDESGGDVGAPTRGFSSSPRADAGRENTWKFRFVGASSLEGSPPHRDSVRACRARGRRPRSRLGRPARMGSERRWQKLRPGDVGLVYSEGQLLLSVEVFAKAKSEDVARSIWGESDEGEVWACMSFLDPVEEVDISIDALRDALGYKPNYVPQGFEIPGDDAQARIREQYGSASRLISALTGAGPKTAGLVGKSEPDVPAGA